MVRIGTYTLIPKKPAIMGIVNVTPDSFSDGGFFLDPKAAIDHALKLLDEGADMIDIGGESTRPGAKAVPAEEEISRIIPVIEGIRKRTSAPTSVDTVKFSVAKKAVEAGADMINDISAGRTEPQILSLAASKKIPICLMHMQGTPLTMQIAPHYNDVTAEIFKFLEDAIGRALKAGIEKERIIIDPGIGFGKTPEDNVKLISGLDKFTALKVPILIGTSRKSFIGKLMGLEMDKRLEATLATLAIAIDRGASILRVHDVGAVRRFVEMYVFFEPNSNYQIPSSK